jgi:hypothetical protein
LPQYAARCTLNLDHHGPGDTADTPSAAEQALDAALPPDGATLVTVRPDALMPVVETEVNVGAVVSFTIGVVEPFALQRGRIRSRSSHLMVPLPFPRFSFSRSFFNQPVHGKLVFLFYRE